MSFGTLSLHTQNQYAIRLLQAAGYTVEHFPNRINKWRVTFRTSEGLGPSLRLALKRCFWACKVISEPANPEAVEARKAAISAMIELDTPQGRQ